MKNIGYNFKTAREEIGLSKEEASKDLEITLSQLDNLEDGNINAFKDMFFLKDLIKKYSKYLNLNEDEIIDEFNDFVFDFTSKIPVSEIEAQLREKHKEDVKESSERIVSPYTIKSKIKRKTKPLIIYITFVIVLIIVVVFVITKLVDSKNNLNVNYNERSYYEHSK